MPGGTERWWGRERMGRDRRSGFSIHHGVGLGCCCVCADGNGVVAARAAVVDDGGVRGDGAGVADDGVLCVAVFAGEIDWAREYHADASDARAATTAITAAIRADRSEAEN